jgi:hypothetical protein
MTLWSKRLGWLVVSVSALFGCGAGDEPPTQVTESEILRSVTYELRVRTPATVLARDVALGADQHLDVGSRAIVSTTPGPGATVTNVGERMHGHRRGHHHRDHRGHDFDRFDGAARTFIGVEAQVGDVWGRERVVVQNRATIYGALRTTVPPLVSADAQVVGGVFDDAVFDPLNVLSWSVTFPGARRFSNVVVRRNQTESLEPDRRYGNVLVHDGGVLRIASGTHYLESLKTLGRDARIEIDHAGGPVFVYVRGEVLHHGTLAAVDGARARLLVGAVGHDSKVDLKGPFSGFVVVPHGTVTLHGRSDFAFDGAFFGKKVVAKPGTRIVGRPFDPANPGGGPPVPPGGHPPPTNGGSTPTAGDEKPNPNYQPGQELCGTGLDLVTIVTGDQDRHTVFAYPQPPIDSTPGVPGCRIAFQVCNDDNTGERTPTADELNTPPALTDVCTAIPARYPCGIDEETIDFSDTGLCNTDAECVGRGMVCALVCGSDAACSVSERRCAQLTETCVGMPEESNCGTVRECAEDNAGGSSDPADHTMAGQPESELAPLDTPEPEAPPLPPVPPYVTMGTGCGGGVLPKVSVIPTPVSKKANSGNDKWGLFITPDVSYDASAQPLTLAGEATLNVTAEARLRAGAYLWGHEVTVLDIGGSAALDTCGAGTAFSRTVEVLGFDVAPGGADPAPAENPDCATARPINDLRKSLFDVMTIADYAGRAGATQDLCELTLFQFGPNGSYSSFPFMGDCTTDAGRREAVFHWINFYKRWRDSFVDAQAAVNLGKQAFVNSLSGGGTLPLVNDERNFTAFDISFQYPVGPVLIVIEIELVGGWGLRGDIVYSLAASPTTTIRAQAQMTPSLGATVLAFAGVGIGPVSVGIGGELVLVDFSTPLTGGVELRQQPSAETRPSPFPGADYAFESVPGAPAGFAPFGARGYDWTASWVYGARAHLETLSGQIDLQARVRLLFFKKTFKKKIADWPGFEFDYVFVGGAGESEPLAGAPDFGQVGEEAYYVDPDWMTANIQIAAMTTDEAPPDALAPCTPPPR